MNIRSLLFLYALILIGCSSATIVEDSGGQNERYDMEYWKVIDRGSRSGCSRVDHFRKPVSRNGLCVSHVDRHVICEGEAPSISSLFWVAALPRAGFCDVPNPERNFVPRTIVQGWEDAPKLLQAAERLLARLPDEYEIHHLTVEQALALHRMGLSSLQSIEFSPSEAFGPDTLRLLFLVDGWSHHFVLLVSKRHPLRNYTWGILLE